MNKNWSLFLYLIRYYYGYTDNPVENTILARRMYEMCQR